MDLVYNNCLYRHYKRVVKENEYNFVRYNFEIVSSCFKVSEVSERKGNTCTDNCVCGGGVFIKFINVLLWNYYYY